MVIGSAHVAFVLAAIVERAQGLVQHSNVDQAQELARFPPSFKRTWPILGGTHELRGSAMHRLKMPEVGVANTPDDVTIAARGLQGACGATQPIEIVSPAFSDLEGCFLITDSATDTLYFSTDVASAVGIIESQDRTFWAAWFYADGSPESNPTIVCYSSEDPDVVDATEATAWICDLDLDGTFEAVTASEFTIDCGCSSASTTDSGDVIAAPSPPAPTPPLGSDSCGDGDAFTIISDEFPETEGCYRDSGRTEEGEPVYTLTGTPFLGQQTVFASVEDDTDEAFWVVSFAAQASSASMAETYCISAEEASSVHPSEVETWGCIIDSVTTTATDAEFSVVCGCSDSGTTETETSTTTSTTTTGTSSTTTTTSITTTDVTVIDNLACSNGVDGIEADDGSVCCVTECGQCGGSGCASAGGLTGDECCTGPIISTGQSCEVTGEAPCIIDMDADETPAPVVPETPSPVVPETPVPVVPETPPPVVPETPVPVVPETPVPVVPETPVPAVPETPAPVVPETSVPVVPETPVPVVLVTLSPVVPETPVPVVPETTVPVVPETPAPSVPGRGGIFTPSPTAMTTTMSTMMPATDSQSMPTSSTSTSTACSNGVVGLESEDGKVCCVTECGQCGGPGCASAGGLTSDECCTEQIVSAGELCEVTGEAPCVIDNAGSPTPSETMPTCSNGLVGIESEDGEICCVADCGVCGGVGCAAAGGLTGDECCTQRIFSLGELCDVAGEAPCIITFDKTKTPTITPSMWSTTPSAAPTGGRSTAPTLLFITFSPVEAIGISPSPQQPAPMATVTPSASPIGSRSILNPTSTDSASTTTASSIMSPSPAGDSTSDGSRVISASSASPTAAPTAAPSAAPSSFGAAVDSPNQTTPENSSGRGISSAAGWPMVSAFSAAFGTFFIAAWW